MRNLTINEITNVAGGLSAFTVIVSTTFAGAAIGGIGGLGSTTIQTLGLTQAANNSNGSLIGIGMVMDWAALGLGVLGNMLSGIGGSIAGGGAGFVVGCGLAGAGYYTGHVNSCF